MANLVSLERAELTLGMSQLLDGVSVGVGEGDRIGIVGRNGGGKTTLLRVLAGDQAVDAGRVSWVGGVRLGRLDQADDLAAAHTVGEIVLGDQAEHEWAGDPRVREVMSGLLGGVDALGVGGLDAVAGRLSGGERRRVSLAALLVADPDLLLLDEPTNHLDIDGVAWLAEYLAQRRVRAGSALVAVTHDRWFLDAVATRTWEVGEGQVRQYDGGYAAYVLARAERERAAAATAARRANLLRKELAWLRRGPPARTSKPGFRIAAATALIADEPELRDTPELVRFAATRLGKDVVDVVDVTVDFGGRHVLDQVTWRLGPGDRFGIVGPNGAGKSTLAKVVLGTLRPTAGRRKVGKTVVAAYLSQDVSELAPLAGLRVLEAISQVRQHIQLGGKDVSASQLATRLGFAGPRQQDRVGELSGGERRRLQLLRLLMSEPNLLVLDEPTNDLDIETLTSMEDVLDDWAGVLLVISHDRYLLERMCDRQVALLGDGRLRDLPGGVEEYLRLRAAQALAAVAAPAPPRGPGPAAAASTREARKEMSRLERRLSRLAEQEAVLHDQVVAQATDHVAVQALDEQLRALALEREELETAWLTAAEAAEGSDGG